MKKIAIGIILNFLLITFSSAQVINHGDFFELGIRSSDFIESSFLESSKYKDDLSDPNIEIEGLIASPTGKNYSVRFRYGKKLSTKTHLITELGYSKLNEQVICFCHVCDKNSNPFTFIRLHSLSAGIGIRHQIFQVKAFSFSLEGIGSYASLINEAGIRYLGYSIHPIIEYQLRNKLSVNLKIGYEQSFRAYEKKEKYIELAIKYQIKNQAS